MDRRLFARRVASLGDSSLKEVLESFPGVISFAGGLPDEKAFPVEQIDEIIGRIAKSVPHGNTSDRRVAPTA